MSRIWLIRLSVLLILMLVSGQAVFSEDVEKKWRIGFTLGSYDTQDDVPSDAANSLFVLEPESGLVERLMRDPRSDDAALGTLGIEPAPRFMASVQYAVNKILVLEAAVGYQKGDVGEIEVQAQYDGIDIPETRNFLFSIYRVPAGDLEQVPIQFSAMARFRPRASFNPFIGAGVGYTLVGFEPSADLNMLSTNLDNSLGAFSALTPDGNGMVTSSLIVDLTGAQVDAPDTVEWHLLGGAEYSFKRKWSAYVDLRYIFASRQFSLRFNGSDSLGVSVPNGAEDEGTPITVSTQYGGYRLFDTGLVDAGRLIPEDPGSVPSNMTDEEYCVENSQLCDFIFEPDGVADPGIYYVKGGDIKYGGFHLGFGVRFTF